MNIFGVIATVAGLASGPAWGGGVLVCGPYGCRSSPYFPPPIVSIGPPVVSTRPPVINVPAALPAAPLVVYPQRAYEPRRGPPPPRQADARPRPPRESGDVEEGREIEGDIMAFCDAHPEEPFCGKLGAFLRKHPERRNK